MVAGVERGTKPPLLKLGGQGWEPFHPPSLSKAGINIHGSQAAEVCTAPKSVEGHLASLDVACGSHNPKDTRCGIAGETEAPCCKTQVSLLSFVL